MKFSLSRDDIAACGFFGCNKFIKWLPFLRSRKSNGLEVFNADLWREFEIGYTRTFHKINYFGMREGEEQTEFVRMDEPRQCSYSSQAYKSDRGPYAKETKILGVPLAHNGPSAKPGSGPSAKPGVAAVEQRGITTRQLRAIMANVIRRCVAEGWSDTEGNLLTPDKVNFYHLDEYIIKPFTIKHKTSFVTALPSTAGAQPPRYFITFWWGMPFMDFMTCLEQVVRDFALNQGVKDDSKGGGMTEDTPIWIVAFANNPWSLGEDITENPKNSGFAKAIMVAHRRNIFILDKEGIAFTRMWCAFECFLTLIGNARLLPVYTTKNHIYQRPYVGEEEREAFGIIPGGSTSDEGVSDYINAREAAFPFYVIKKALHFRVEEAKASVEDDRIHILNSMVGRSNENLNCEPFKTHDTYVAINDALKGTFASSSASLIGAAEEGGDCWTEMLKALSKGSMSDGMEFDFDSGGIWRGLTGVQATQLVAHLPILIERLTIRNADFGCVFMSSLIKRVRQMHGLKNLRLWDTIVGGGEEGLDVGLYLAKIISTNTTIETLRLMRTDLIRIENSDKWVDALMENKALTWLGLLGVEENLVQQLRVETCNRTPELKIKK